MESRSGDGNSGRDGHDSRRSPPGSRMSPFNRGDRDRYYGRPKRSRSDYPESDGGYKRRWEQRPPHRGQRGWRGDPRGGFRGNSGSTPTHNTWDMPRTVINQLKESSQSCFFGGGFKQKPKNWKVLNFKLPEEAEQSAVKKMGSSAENSKPEESGSNEDEDAEEAAQSTTTEGGREDGRPEETEDIQKERECSLVNGIQYYCRTCEFRSFYEEEYNLHIQSRFHKEHFQYLKEKLPRIGVDYLQTLQGEGYRSTQELRSKVEDLSATIIQISRNRDPILSLGLGMEQFMKKVDVLHCTACDRFIPMQYYDLREHLKSSSHKQRCKTMMRNSTERVFIRASKNLSNWRHEIKLHQTNSQNPLKDDKKNTRGGRSTGLSPKTEDSGQMPCITVSDSEGEEDDDLQGQSSFIGDDEDDSENDCSTELPPKADEAPQIPRNTLPDPIREKEGDSGGEVAEQEDAKDSS
ncbi:A-kinase anchor protein 8-like isoform X2 [Dendropsophus ebraccatus]|uniref:A-kinase anchor protein 8-like isoform X2 n=1 Tax=Dendropsophus ebraccatus TaxID=150705 RepID=UPI003831509F